MSEMTSYSFVRACLIFCRVQKKISMALAYNASQHKPGFAGHMKSN
jgi:hypothetical protein